MSSTNNDHSQIGSLLETDAVQESWKAEEKSVNRTIIFNLELILYNVLLLAYGIRYKKSDTIDDQVMIYLFPSLKALFLWINVEFAFRYSKTAYIMKLMFHPDPIE